MNPALLIAALAAAVGYSRVRAKRKKLTSALLWGAAGYVAVTYGTPYLRRALPA